MGNKQSEEVGRLLDPGYVYKVTINGKPAFIRISRGDDIILKAYAGRYQKPEQTVLDEMIGAACKCWEENHVNELQELREWKKSTIDYELIDTIMWAYYKTYGPLRVRNRRGNERFSELWERIKQNQEKKLENQK